MKEKISMVIFILILGTFLTASLVGVNNYTEPIIEKNKELKIKSSVLKAFNIPFGKDILEKVFSENISTVHKNDNAYYISKDNDVAFEISGRGVWGPISGVIALRPDLETIKGITIIHQEETPGLGGRISEKKYLLKFKDKRILPYIKIVTKGKAEKKNEVDGITGATMTVKAFEKLINDQTKKNLALFREK